MKRLEGKVAIVTGGASGIGKSICETFVREGAFVVSADMKLPTESREHVEDVALNVTNRTEIEQFVEGIVKKYGQIDILVNNAGITKDALIHKMTEEMWDLVIDVNLKGVFNLTQAVGPRMMESGKGSIINIASVVGEYGNVGQTNYAATKAGVIGMAKSWAKEFSRKGAPIRVNSVAPGYVNTEMMKTVPDKVLDPI